MTYLVIDTEGVLQERDAEPTSAAIRAEVGEPGWGMVRMPVPDGTLRGWVNDSGHLAGLLRNVVGSLLLMCCGASQQPYAGPVVITGWDQYAEVVPLTPDRVEKLRALHSDIRRVLGLDPGEVSAGVPPGVRAGLLRAAEMVGAAPTPTIAPRVPGSSCAATGKTAT